ncbi:MAG: Multidrug efflux protein, outer membrane component [uncultured Aureispira sp.]|uniref:Multidrug efflux protein, outer membrane component n=1 Tax=uncultured Aureispira sp. TaxID=1331704 RepID=A0A6S6STH6_9BACT|nr:MAG: Multidrug efflux protein, outer membrane component [uncultured Aureispira sp.]
MKPILIAFVLFCSTNLLGQTDSLLITYEQFLQQIYESHPISKQINIQRDVAAQYLKKARGGFDPKVGANWDFKNFDQKNYYNLLNAYLKVPVWSDIAIEAGYNYTNGYYLNPENKLPQAGQAYLGVKIPLLNGLWTSERRTTLEQAKLMLGASEAEIQALLNDLLYKAGKTYWDWVKVYSELLVVRASLENARLQFEATKSAFRQGDKPAVDTLKSFIQIQERTVLLANKQIEVQNAARLVSAYLWNENQEPLILQEGMYPVGLQQLAMQPLEADLLKNSLNQLQQHPAILMYDFKLENLDLERKLKVNNLLPKLDFKYNFLSTEHVDFFASSAAAPVENYKLGVTFSMPIFIRKERADLALVQLKLKATSYQQEAKRRDLQVKVENYFNEVQNFALQTTTIEQMVANYTALLEVERIKFSIGESSVFMVNTRENQLLDAQMKLIKQQVTYLKSRTAFFWITANLQTN